MPVLTDPPRVRRGSSDALLRSIRPTASEIRRARRQLHVKAVFIVALVAFSYWGLVFADVGLALRILFALAFVVAVVCVGTGIMHDANHGAFSRSRRANRGIAFSADVLGASSWVWRFKHNTLHHGSTNVVGRDSDIEQSPFARLAPQQPWRPWHRHQHLYMWFLYGFLTIKWFVVSDMVALAKGGFGDSRFGRKARTGDVAILAAGKVTHVVWAIVVPLMMHPWWGVLAFYSVCSWLVGFILAMVFQLAHCTDEVEFLDVSDRASAEPFEVLQLRTTADIRCRLPIAGGVVRWVMGGLDHQIEHHLAPRLPHTIYPTMAARLHAACDRRGVPYHVHPSMWSAVRAHGRWLKRMGQEPATPLTGSRRGRDAELCSS
jgi:linoleoyl-CoA desaturase